MRRPYPVFLLASLLPSVLAVGAAAMVAERGWTEEARASQLRAGQMARAILEQRGAEDPDAPGAADPGSALLQALEIAGFDAAIYVDGRRHEEAAGALILAFAALAGWIQLGGRPPGEAGRWLVVVSLVPALTASSLLLHAGRLHEEGASTAQRKELGRALAVARTLEIAGDPVAFHALTGYHAFRVRGGTVVAATLEGPAPAVAGLRTPPPNFTAAGRVATPQGNSTYVAARLGEGDMVVATTPSPGAGVRSVKARLRWVAIGLWGWMALATAAAFVRRRSVSS